MTQVRPPIDEVHSAYLLYRGKAQSTSTRRLRRCERRLNRRHDSLDQPGLARLKATRDELADRQR